MLPLQKLCFFSIIGAFERFYFAFKESDDKILKQNFEFLQRKYSFELVSHLFKKEKLKFEYLDMFLNQHLKILKGCWLKPDQDRTLSGNILCRLPNLVEILFPIKCSDEDVKNVAKFCPKIASIDVTKSLVTDDGIKYLCKDENGKLPCPELKKLFIADSDITDEGVKYLIQNLPSLEVIDYKNVPLLLYSLHKEDLSKHEKMYSYNLVHMDLLEISDLSYYTDILKVCFTVCPKLNSIKCRISDEQQLHLFSNTSLEVLCIEFTQAGPKININNFLKDNGCNLKDLSVCNCIMSIAYLAVSCPKLNHLCLEDITFTDDGDSQPVFNCLVKCIFKFIKDDISNNKAMRFLFSFSRKLEYIGFAFCVLPPDTKSHLLKCCKNIPIKDIVFKGTAVEINFLKDILLNSPSLMNLCLGKCHLPIETMKLADLIKTLPNKPHIYIDILPTDIEDYDDSLISRDESGDEQLFFLSIEKRSLVI